MKFTFENQGNSTYLVTELPADVEVDTMTLGMITNNSIKGLAPTIFTQLDDSKYMKYNITSKISLSQLFAGPVNKKRVLDTFDGICDTLLIAEDYMIDSHNFLYDTDYIYVNVSSSEIALICVPIMEMEQNIQGVGSLIKNIMFSAQFEPTENTDYVGKIINYLNSTMSFSVVDFKNLLSTLNTNAPELKSTQVNLQAPASVPVQSTVDTTSINTTVPTQTQQPVVPASSNSTATVGGDAPSSNIQIPISVQPTVLKSNSEVQKERRADTQTKKTKKGFGLFGSKEKPEKKKRNVKDVTSSSGGSKMPNMAIPGMTPPPNQQVNIQVPDAKVLEAVQNSISIDSNPVDIKTVKANFGETTVLGGGASIGETTVLNSNQMVNAQPYLVRMKTDEHIPLTKPVFRIGKEKSYVDYFISDNTAISRSHANVLIREGKYYIVDTNSTNHTYVDDQLLSSKMETEIVHGTKIRLANEDFEFRLF